MSNTYDEKAIQALSDAGAFCGVCGFQPGDRGCPDCEGCWRNYVDALRKAGWAPAHELAEKQRGQLLPDDLDTHAPYNRTVRRMADLIDPEVPSA